MKKVYIDKEETKEFFKGIWLIGIPVIVQSLINSLVNMLDVFMVGQLGEVDITAASLGNAWFFLFSLLCGGVSAAGSIFIAQYWGKRDKKRIKEFMGIMFIGVFFLIIIFGCSSIFLSHGIIGISSRDGLVIEHGAGYVKIIGFSYLFTGTTNVLSASLRSTEKAKVPMLATILSLTCNVCLNYILIFGHLGMPAMGIYGAAVATLISRIAECLFIILVSYAGKYEIMGKIGDYFKIQKESIEDYIHYGFFVILGEGIYAVGNYAYNIAYKYTGTQAQAALQIVNTMNALSMVLAIGIGNSAGVVIGKLLGKNQLEKAKRFCNKYLIFSPIAGAVIAVFVVLFAPLILQFFNIGEAAQEYARKMMYVLAMVLPFKAINFTIIVGILRSGGDSTYCFISNFCGTWLIGLPLAFLGAVVLQSPIYIVYLLAGFDEIGKFFICFPRAVKYKWIQNLTKSEEAVQG